MRHVSMRFGATRALDDASITVRHGEIHALLGQNGSGKSTLVKVLAGYHVPSAGAELAVGGRRLEPPFQPGLLRELGVRFVHQDLGLIPSLSVVENLLLDDLAGRLAGARISWSKERARAAETFERFGAQLDPRARVADLAAADRALLAVVRAVRDGPSLLVLDEPTTLLPPARREGLLTLLREIVARGSSIVLVSHELGEVVRVADRVTILRDGRSVATVDPSVAGDAGLVELVVGRALDPLAPRQDRAARVDAPIAIAG
ncbi:MAG TPA: ATP-binding cassette domain-containing protein, partial [Thermoleophilaceae bacterium]|nr:ATP-binding cassette domain-containing protein [Thermoleophilaceae bacterium]